MGYADPREAPGGTVRKKTKAEPVQVTLPHNDDPNPAIQANGLGRRFGRKWVVREMDLSVPVGSVTALLGRNGVGKSTTIQMLLGLLPPSEGSVSVLGLDPTRKRTQLFKDVAYVSERRELLEDQTVEGLSRIVADVHGARFDLDAFVLQAKRYQLARDARCRDLSKGQRARLLLALALCARPRLLVLDEPTSGLDVVVRDDFLEAIAEFAAQEGHAVLLSTHLIDDVARICDRAIVLREDQPPLIGDLEDLRASVGRYLVRLQGVIPEHQGLALPAGAVLVEREPRALTILAQGAGERFEAVLDASLPLAGIERRPATLKEAFTCLTEPARGEAPK